MKPFFASVLFLLLAGVGYCQTETDSLYFDPSLDTVMTQSGRFQKDAFPGLLNIKRPARVRIYSPYGETAPIITVINPDSVDACTVNTVYPDTYVLLSWVLKNRIRFTWNGQTLLWKPGTENYRTELRRFSEELNGIGLEAELNLDPSLFFCVEPNSHIRVSISYEFVMHDSFNAEQKRETIDVFVDNEGIATLPVLYESVAPGIEPGYQDGFFSMWYDAQSNAYKFKVADGKNCGGEHCISYHEAAKRITEMYRRRLGDNQVVSNVYVRIEPPDFFGTVTVCRKGKCVDLSYAHERIEQYLNRASVRAKTGIKRKGLKGVVISRCNLSQKAISRPFKTKRATRRTLLPGDIIFIK